MVEYADFKDKNTETENTLDWDALMAWLGGGLLIGIIGGLLLLTAVCQGWISL